MPSSFSILERSDRLPRHQTSNTLLIFFQNRRASSPSSHHPSLCRSKMTNSTRTAVLSVDTLSLFCWSILGVCLSKRCLLCSFSSLPPFYGSLIKRLACNRPPCRLAHTAAHNCRLPWPGNPPQHTRRVSVTSWVPVLWPFSFLPATKLAPVSNFCAEKDKLACIIFAQVSPP